MEINIVQTLDAGGALITEYDKAKADKFGHAYLRRDGAFVIATIEQNCSSSAARDLVLALWKVYRAKPELKKDFAKGDVMYI